MSEKGFTILAAYKGEYDFEIPKSPETRETFYCPRDFLIVKVYAKSKDAIKLYLSKVLYPQDDAYVKVYYKKKVPQT